MDSALRASRLLEVQICYPADLSNPTGVLIPVKLSKSKGAALKSCPWYSGGPTGIDLVHPWTRPCGLLASLEVQICYPADLSNPSGVLIPERLQNKKGSPECRATLLLFSGGPTGIRTPVLALRGPRPRPLDDRTRIYPMKDTTQGLVLSTVFSRPWAISSRGLSSQKTSAPLSAVRWKP